MGWANFYIEKLQRSETVKFRPKGHSMKGKINSGDLVTIEPINKDLNVGDIVLCKVKGREYLHLISAIKKDQYQISNNKGFVNGWISKNAIFGICTKIEI